MVNDQQMQVKVQSKPILHESKTPQRSQRMVTPTLAIARAQLVWNALRMGTKETNLTMTPTHEYSPSGHAKLEGYRGMLAFTSSCGSSQEIMRNQRKE